MHTLLPVGSAGNTVLAGGSRPFLPTDVSGLIGWYDFSDITTLWKDTARTSAVTTDGDAIAGVTDKSGVGNHLSQATAGKCPLYKAAILNSKSIGRWDAVDDTLATPAFVGGDKAQPNTIFVVGKTLAGNFRFYTDGLTNTKRHVLIHNDVNTLELNAGTALVSGAIGDTNYHIFGGVFNGASSKLYVGGGAAVASGDAGAQALGGLTLGSGWDGSFPLNGDIGAVLVYTGAFSTTDLDLDGNYFATQWNLAWSASS